MSKHTPTPWGIELDTCITLGEDNDSWNEQGNPWHAEAYGQGAETDKANAEHIVKCVNENERLHAERDELVAALEELLEAYTPGEDEHCDDTAEWDRARAILAKVKS